MHNHIYMHVARARAQHNRRPTALHIYLVRTGRTSHKCILFTMHVAHSPVRLLYIEQSSLSSIKSPCHTELANNRSARQHDSCELNATPSACCVAATSAWNFRTRARENNEEERFAKRIGRQPTRTRNTRRILNITGSGGREEGCGLDRKATKMRCADRANIHCARGCAVYATGQVCRRAITTQQHACTLSIITYPCQNRGKHIRAHDVSACTCFVRCVLFLTWRDDDRRGRRRCRRSCVCVFLNTIKY